MEKPFVLLYKYNGELCVEEYETLEDACNNYAIDTNAIMVAKKILVDVVTTRVVSVTKSDGSHVPVNKTVTRR